MMRTLKNLMLLMFQGDKIVKVNAVNIHKISTDITVTFEELANYYWDNGNLEDFGRIMAAVYTDNVDTARDYLEDYVRTHKNSIDKIFQNVNEHNIQVNIEEVNIDNFDLGIEVES